MKRITDSPNCHNSDQINFNNRKMEQVEIIFEGCRHKGLHSRLSDTQIARRYIVKRVKPIIKYKPSTSPFLTLCSLK